MARTIEITDFAAPELDVYARATENQLVVDLVRRQHEKAVQLLTNDREKLDQLAQYLYEKETITGEEFMKILNG